jgi:hypothetical protein
MSDDRGVASLPVISRNNTEHYAWGTGCDGWHLVRDSDLSVIEEDMPAGASEVSHCHRKSRQLFLHSERSSRYGNQWRADFFVRGPGRRDAPWHVPPILQCVG